MSFPYSGASNDFGFKTEPCRAPPLTEQQLQQCCIGDFQASQFPSWHRHLSQPNWVSAEHGMSTFSTQLESSTVARKQAATVGFFPCPVSENNPAVSDAFFAYSDNSSTDNYYFSKSTSYPRNSPLGFKMPSGSYEASSDDAENEKTANVLVALVNQLLEDTDCDNLSTSDTQQLAYSAQSMCFGNESIGELAIKLADIALIDNGSVAQPDCKSSSQPVFAPTGGAPQVAKPQTVLPLNAGSNLNAKYYKKEEPTSASQIESSVNAPETSKKNDIVLVNYEKKKNVPWNGPFHKQIGNPPKGLRKVVSESIGSYSVNQGPRQAFRKAAAPFFVPQGGSSRIKDPPKRHSGTPFWKQLPVDSRSDGTSSSNSSVYRDSTFSPSTDSKYKLFKSKEGQFPSMKQPQRFHKTYSSSSSSSGGGKFAECVFCKTNGETSAMYRSHVLKDEQGRTACHVLQGYICPLCGATGFNAHTVKYCPKNENPPPIATMTTLKSMRSSTGRKRRIPCSGHIRSIPFIFNRGPQPA